MFYFPFQIPGDTNENPLLIPDEYQESLDSRDADLFRWKGHYFSEDYPAELREDSDQNILNSFWAWLSVKGYGREIDGLVNLKNMLDKNYDDDGSIKTEFDFSEFSGNPPVTLSLTDLLSKEESVWIGSDFSELDNNSFLCLSLTEPSLSVESPDAANEI
jgi:hypothetical protein